MRNRKKETDPSILFERLSPKKKERYLEKEIKKVRSSRVYREEEEDDVSAAGDLSNMGIRERMAMIRAGKGGSRKDLLLAADNHDVDVTDRENDVLLETPLPTTLAIDLIPVDSIRNGTICTEDGRYLKIIEIMPINFLLKSQEEQENIIYEFEKFLRVIPDNIQIKSLAKKTDITMYLDKIEEDLSTEKDPKCRALIEDGKNLIRTVGAAESVSRRFFLIIELEKQMSRTGSPAEIENSLNIMKDRCISYLRQCGNGIVEMKNNTDETARILFDIFNRNLNSSADFPARVSSVYGYYDSHYGKKATKIIPVKEYFTPKKINMKHPDYIKMDDTFYAFMYVKAAGYPTEVPKGWTSLIINAGEGIDADIFIQRQSRMKYLNMIGRHLRWNHTKAKDISTTTAEYDELTGSISSGYYLKNGLAGGVNDFFYFAILITVTADSLTGLRRKYGAMETYLKTHELSVGNCNFEQKDALTSYMPLCSLSKKIWLRAKRNILTEGLAACYPFTSYEMSDADGIFLGVNEMNNSLCIADFFCTKTYKNANIAIMGTTGAGKTYLLQILAMRLRKKKIQTFIIAPDKGHEFRRACENIGGEFISLSPGGSQCINVMEIRKKDDSANKILDGSGIVQSELALKIQSLHIFFQLLIPALTPEEDQILDEVLILTYNKKGITHNNASLSDPDRPGQYREMPVLGDVYEELKKRLDARHLKNMLTRFVNGSVSSLNQQTNVDVNNLYTVIDISTLTGDLLTAGMFIALDFVYGRAKENRTKKKAIIIDEIWELIGSKSNARAAEYTLEIFKIIRGYGGAAICATQDLNDFFALEDGKYGKGIINNCKTKIVLNLENKEARAVKELLALSEEEYKQVIRFERGHGLLSTNGNNIPIHFKASELENALITTDRAQLDALVKMMQTS